jgi:hypothetical protein
MRLKVWLAVTAFGVSAPGRPVEAQEQILLRINPQVGDTLRMRLDQQTEIVGTRRAGSVESTSSIINTMQMFSRAIVEGLSARGTTVLAVTDSVLFLSTDERTRPARERAQRSLAGQSVRFHVAPDGTMAMSDDGNAPREVSEAVSLMPAAFPKGPVAVGESWIREMMLPGGSRLGTPVSGKLRVTFRLDSMVRGGELAYVSMRGEMQPTPAFGAATSLEKGSVTGTMLLNRKRGWLTESRFFIAVTSTIGAAAATGMTPMRMHVRITQHMRTMDTR